MGIASLVLGVCSLLFSFVPVFGCVLGIIGICLARGCHDSGQRGFAVGGLSCSIVGLCICALVTLGVACAAGYVSSM